MGRILHIDASVENPQESYSRRVSAAVVSALTANRPEAAVSYLDLAFAPPPHIDRGLKAGWMTPAEQRTPNQAAAVARSEAYISELKAADVLVIGSPMYNLSVPSSLKTWIDNISIAGQTFRYTADGAAEGLLLGKKAYLALARGGIYSEGPASAFDYQEPYLRAVMGFLGVTDVEVIRAEGVAINPEIAQAALEAALSKAAGLKSLPLAA
jgi:FMN-dependent NADH-azoreductase